MDNAKTKLQSLGFNSAHAKLLTVVVGVFVVLFFAKSNLDVKTLFVKADSKQEVLTYDEVKNQVAQKYQSSSAGEDDSSDQVALLSRGDVDGKVLGDAIGIGEIPDADQLLLPEISDQLQITKAPTDNADARSAYQIQAQQIENDADITGLLAEINSDDQSTLEHSVNGWEWVINTLSKVPVPASLEKFHKDKLIYYSVLMNTAKIYSHQKSEDDLPLLTKAMLSYSQKIEETRNTLNTTYNLSL